MCGCLLAPGISAVYFRKVQNTLGASSREQEITTCVHRPQQQNFTASYSLRFLLPRDGPAPSYQDCKGIGEAHIYSFLLSRVPNFGSRMKSPSKSGMETEKTTKWKQLKGWREKVGRDFISPLLNWIISIQDGLLEKWKGPRVKTSVLL